MANMTGFELYSLAETFVVALSLCGGTYSVTSEGNSDEEAISFCFNRVLYRCASAQEERSRFCATGKVLDQHQ